MDRTRVNDQPGYVKPCLPGGQMNVKSKGKWNAESKYYSESNTHLPIILIQPVFALVPSCWSDTVPLKLKLMTLQFHRHIAWRCRGRKTGWMDRWVTRLAIVAVTEDWLCSPVVVPGLSDCSRFQCGILGHPVEEEQDKLLMLLKIWLTSWT